MSRHAAEAVTAEAVATVEASEEVAFAEAVASVEAVFAAADSDMAATMAMATDIRSHMAATTTTMKVAVTWFASG